MESGQHVSKSFGIIIKNKEGDIMGNEIGGGKGNRILDIYTRLLEGHVITKSEMAVKYGVNEKSIQRDIEEIRNFLEDNRAERAIPNSIVYDYKERGYRMEQSTKMHFTNDEVLAISKILLDSRAFTKKEMMTILDKMLDCCVPLENKKMVNSLIANEKFHYVELQHKKVFLDKMWAIGQAIKECKIIKIDYARTKDKKVVHRTIQPLAILFSEYYFYVVGFIQGIDKAKAFDFAEDPFPTIYRMDRIEKLEVTEVHFKIPYANRFEEGEFRKRIQFMYGGRLQTVRFEYCGTSIEAVLDKLPTAKILSECDGKYVVQAEVFGKGIEMWLRSQGENVKMLDGKKRTI